MRDELLGMAWESRRAFVYELEALSSSLERAKELALQQTDKQVILLDHYDNCGSGGTMDTTAVLDGGRGGVLRTSPFSRFLIRRLCGS